MSGTSNLAVVLPPPDQWPATLPSTLGKAGTDLIVTAEYSLLLLGSIQLQSKSGVHLDSMDVRKLLSICSGSCVVLALLREGQLGFTAEAE